MTVSFSKIQLKEWARNLDIAYGELAAKKDLHSTSQWTSHFPNRLQPTIRN